MKRSEEKKPTTTSQESSAMRIEDVTPGLTSTQAEAAARSADEELEEWDREKRAKEDVSAKQADELLTRIATLRDSLGLMKEDLGGKVVLSPGLSPEKGPPMVSDNGADTELKISPDSEYKPSPESKAQEKSGPGAGTESNSPGSGGNQASEDDTQQQQQNEQIPAESSQPEEAELNKILDEMPNPSEPILPPEKEGSGTATQQKNESGNGAEDTLQKLGEEGTIPISEHENIVRDEIAKVEQHYLALLERSQAEYQRNLRTRPESDSAGGSKENRSLLIDVRI